MNESGKSWGTTFVGPHAVASFHKLCVYTMAKIKIQFGSHPHTDPNGHLILVTNFQHSRYSSPTNNLRINCELINRLMELVIMQWLLCRYTVIYICMLNAIPNFDFSPTLCNAQAEIQSSTTSQNLESFESYVYSKIRIQVSFL